MPVSPLMPILNAQGTPYRDLEVVRPAREQGREAGAVTAPNEDVFVQVIDAALTCMLDETQRESDRERAYENVIGFAEGWAAMMDVKPLLFLTRQQTAKVNALPRKFRLAFMSEYKRGVRQWQRRGGALVAGNRPVIPVPPGEEVTE